MKNSYNTSFDNIIINYDFFSIKKEKIDLIIIILNNILFNNVFFWFIKYVNDSIFPKSSVI